MLGSGSWRRGARSKLTTTPAAEKRSVFQCDLGHWETFFPLDIAAVRASNRATNSEQGRATYLSAPKVAFNMFAIRRQCGIDEGFMDELIGRLVANVGVDRLAAEKAVGIILDFLRKEGPPDKVQALFDRMPGSDAMAQQADSGGGMGGIMGAGTKMMAAGLSMGQVQGVTREVIGFAREKAGEDAVGQVVGAIPGLSQFV
jgi:hypothetical protein